MTSKEIRRQFLEFFESKGHKIVDSAPLVMKNDPTLLFTNAGMNQFKNIFLGNSRSEDSRVANSQKCLRVSGKHNDLEEVGLDTYHHTLFEMLGNWSFGDYFKKEAIELAWELITEVYKLPKERLYVTVYEGDKSDKLNKDEEALKAWESCIDNDKIILASKKDNFWEMGETGPCGPSSEIHIDLRSEEEIKELPTKELINKDHPSVIEIWNLVFIEFNRTESGKLEKLPQKHIDTGMGLERLCMAMNGHHSTYDTDLFVPLIKKIEQLSKLKYEGGEDKKDIAFRVVVDHIRAVTFAISESQLPGNSGAGYVIRRILRRAIRYGYSFLNLQEPFMFQLVTVLEGIMADFYPEISKEKDFIVNVIKEEEENFLKTLETGINKIEQHKEDKIGGEFAFELYDTYGFPIDLTRLIANEKGWKIDEEGFNQNLQQQKERSKAAGKLVTGDWTILKEDDKEEFIGYDELSSDIFITRYREVKLKGKKLYQLVFNLTPFYPEGGGQVGDKGHIISLEEKVEIIDTKKENDLILHITESLPRNPRVIFDAQVDKQARRDSARNHSVTHLLHHALRNELGEHVTQKGSLVHPDYLRFDFSHFQKVSPEELRNIEESVNKMISKGLELEESRNIPLKTAREMGALALFGEKYGDVVRVIKFGNSVELCGGTHVSNTQNIGYFKIMSESSVAAGVRRIEAISGRRTMEYFAEQERLVKEISGLLKSPTDPVKALKQLIKTEDELKNQLDSFKKGEGNKVKEELEKEISNNGNMKFLAKEVDLDAGTIKNIAFEFRKKYPNLFLVLGSANSEKVILSVMVGDELVKDKGMHAGDIVKQLSTYIKGGGGGQPFFATAGGKDPKGLNKAIKEALGISERFGK